MGDVDDNPVLHTLTYSSNMLYINLSGKEIQQRATRYSLSVDYDRVDLRSLEGKMVKSYTSRSRNAHIDSGATVLMCKILRAINVVRWRMWSAELRAHFFLAMIVNERPVLLLSRGRTAHV